MNYVGLFINNDLNYLLFQFNFVLIFNNSTFPIGCILKCLITLIYLMRPFKLNQLEEKNLKLISV